MLDYEFGKGTSQWVPADGLKFYYSRRSDRLKQVTHDGRLFAVIRPNGSVALSVYSAALLARSRAFLENTVTVSDDAASFVREGKSVFCKFVVKAGRRISTGGEVAILDGRGRVIGVGRARLPGIYMREFKAGVAVKVRSAQDQ
jgi:uncharacterized protein with predicted RNA binding PUA domain